MAKPLRALIVEDSEDDTRLMVRALEKGGYDLEAQRVETPEAMRAALAEKTWDAVLADYTLPRFSGLAALKLFQETGIDLPFIIVSGTIGEETAVKAMKAGAHDYVMKNNLPRLIPVIEREMREALIRRERQQAEKSRQQSEARLRYLISSCPAVIYTAKPADDYSITFVSPNVTALLGYGESDFVDDRKFWIDHIHPHDRPCVFSELTNLFSYGYYACEYRFQHKNGGYRWLRDDMMLVRDPAGVPAEIIGSWIDITERKEAEESYVSIFQNAPVGIFRSSPAGRFLTANHAMAHIFGYASPEELITSITDITRQLYVNPDDRRLFLDLMEKAGLVKGFEAQYYRKDGSLMWASLNIRTLHDESGRPLYHEGIVEDITERKKSVENLRQALVATVQAMATAVETRDPYTAGHQRRVADLTCMIARELELPSEQIEGIRLASSIHDIGKIAVPSEILSKPTQISDIEYKLLKTHAQIGYEILKDIEFPWPIARIVHEHHERLDGSGYPRGLTGDELLIDSQILAVADVVEAIASYRPYRPAVGIEKALDEVNGGKGVLYNRDAVAACLKIFQEKGYKFPA